VLFAPIAARDKVSESLVFRARLLSSMSYLTAIPEKREYSRILWGKDKRPRIDIFSVMFADFCAQLHLAKVLRYVYNSWMRDHK
jgi:hypothetical protein